MKIKNVEINGSAALAPMAGVADRAFRELCKQYGSAYSVSEMVSSKGVSYKSQKSTQLMEISDIERPCGVQLFGDDPATMAQAAIAAMQFRPEIIDINMGCPAPKISGNGCGSALMKTPERCGEIVKAVSNAVAVPVTVKIRKGWDDASVNAVEIAQICEANGAAAIAVHGRTRAQQYSGTADWSIIKQVKNAVKIPVIGNGDITTAEKACQMLEDTGCDMVMIGRGALGNPWIFMEINAYLSDLRMLPPPSKNERLTVMLKHIEKICEYKGEKHGILEARKHITWYLKGFNGAAKFRKAAGEISSLDELKSLIISVHKYTV